MKILIKKKVLKVSKNELREIVRVISVFVPERISAPKLHALRINIKIII